MVELFQVLADATAAVYQAGLLAGAGLCSGTGALLVGNRLYWRLSSRRVEGTVIGVREISRFTYFPAYRYPLPDGATGESTSDTASSFASKIATGRRVPLLVLRRDPSRVTEADGRVMELVGCGLLVVAAALIYLALTAWPITRLTWILLAGLALYCASGLYKAVPRTNPEAPRPLLLRRQPAYLPSMPVQRIELILSRRQAAAQEARRKTGRVVKPVLVLVGIVVLALGVDIGRKVSRLENSGARADGTVVGIDIEATIHSRNYYPLVSFKTREGLTVEFRDGTGSNPSRYREGDVVTVLYLPGSPEDTAMIDRGRWNWLGPVALCLFGTILSLVALRARLGSVPPNGAPDGSARRNTKKNPK